ncbi:MAG: YceI family protein, partial [Pseudomonadota bacterium]
MRLLPAAAAVAVVALASSPVAAQSIDVPSGTYALDKTHASIVWKVSHIGYSTYTGMFQRGAIDATITLDAEDVAKSSVTATIEGTGVETLHPVDFDPRGTDFNAEVAGDKFLNANSFPAITFKSTGIEVTGDNTANISGELTLNNATHPVV